MKTNEQIRVCNIPVKYAFKSLCQSYVYYLGPTYFNYLLFNLKIYL